MWLLYLIYNKFLGVPTRQQICLFLIFEEVTILDLHDD